MRHLGIDYGTKRIGIAVSDALGTMAFPKLVVPNDANLLEVLKELIEEYQVAVIVVGHSLDANKQPNSLQAAIDELITDLTLQFAVPVHLEPEQYTTQAALRIQGRTSQTDASAAALILDAYLQKHKSNH